MKKSIFFGTVLLIGLLAFAGCGISVVKNQTTPGTEGSTSTDGTTTPSTNTTTTTTSDEDIPPPSDNPADYLNNFYTQDIVQTMIQQELYEFEQTDAIDPPAGFPLGFLYANGKVVGMSDDSDEYYIYKSVTIKTTDDATDVKSFYKNILVDPWDITSQSVDGGNVYYYATNSETSMEIDVSIYSDDLYSELVEIDIYYSGYLQ